MLVSPLMTPIFGITLGLVRGDATLLGKAIRAEIADTVLRDYLIDWIGFDLLDVGLLNLPDRPVAVATFTGFTPRPASAFMILSS